MTAAERVRAEQAEESKKESKKPPPWRRCRDLVDEILNRASEPWTDLTLGNTTIASVRAGGIALLIGGTGRGKTSMAASLLVQHAKDHGPAISMSLELPADEWTARAIGTREDASWPDVLRGHVPREAMERAMPERLVVIERHMASIEALRTAIADMRDAYPDQPILVAVDYVQLMPSDEREIRRRVADAMAKIDSVAREGRAVVLALSQGSRQSTRELASGEKLGAETADTGAEAAELERWATVTLAIGALGPEAEDGTCAADVSIGKSRMGGGDRVLPARYCGRSGLWRVVGEARTGAEVRAEREAGKSAKKTKEKAAVVAAELAKSDEPLSRREISRRVGGRDESNRAAVAVLLADPESGVVELEPRYCGSYLVWTREKALAAGKTIHE